MSIIEANIAGIRFYPEAGRVLKAATERPGVVVARLEREPDNKFDPNAVAIYVGGTKVGHVDRASARHVAKAMDNGQRLRATLRKFRFLRIDLHYKAQYIKASTSAHAVDEGLNDAVPDWQAPLGTEGKLGS